MLVQVTSLLTLPFAVSGTDMCAFVPARLARRCLDILDLVVADDPARRRCRSPRPRTGTRGARPSPPWSGCAGCSTTSPIALEDERD